MTLKEQLLKETINPEFKLRQKASEVLEALEYFLKTGKIDNILIQGFTQHGNWMGVYGAEEIGQHNHILQGTILPKEKRTRTDNNGNIHLLTNYRNIDNSQKIEIPYKTIAGVLSAPFCKTLKAEHLTRVGGKIEIDKAIKVELPKLREVKGPLALSRVKELNLEKIEKIGGVLNIYRATKLNAPRLKEVKHIRFDNLSKENKKTIVKNLSINSLLSIKQSTYMPTELKLINDELGRKKILQTIQNRGNTKEIPLTNEL